MQVERDLLVKNVFPALRRTCESRGVSLTEVDLRWGITEEEAQTGRVLEICLREAVDCRPYFIGVLGSRYGWVPDAIPQHLLEEFPVLRDSRGQSITEIEIRQGILAAQTRRDRAAFYFRATPGGNSDDPRIVTLKNTIRQSGILVRERYRDATELAELVSRDLQGFIESDYPEKAPPGAYAAAQLRHSAFLATQHVVHVPLMAVREQLERVWSNGGQLLVTGETGMGKSALLANWCRQRGEGDPADALVVACHVGSTVPPTLADVLAFLVTSLSGGEASEVAQSLDALRAAFAQRLRAAAARRRVVLILDGVDHLIDSRGARELTWLPRSLPPDVTAIISAGPGKSADECRSRGWTEARLQPLERDARVRLATEYLAVYQKKLSAPQLERLVSAATSGNPLALRTLLEELRVFGSFELFDLELNRYAAAVAPVELFVEMLQRLERDFESARPRLVRDALCLLCCSREGLREAELLDLLGLQGAALPQAYWSPLWHALASHVTSLDGMLRVSTTALRHAVLMSYMSGVQEQQEFHRRLARYFDQKPATPRSLKERPWQLGQAGEWNDLGALLTDPAFIVAAAKADWAAFMQSAGALTEQGTFDPLAFFESNTQRFEKRMDALALVAYLLEHQEWDERGLERQIKQEDEARTPGTLETLERLRGTTDLSFAGIRSDVAAGRRGFWSRLHAAMLRSPYHRLRIVRAGDGLALQLHASQQGPETAGAVRSLDYRTEDGRKFALMHYHADTKRAEAQKLLNVAGFNFGHSALSFLGVDTPPAPKVTTPQEMAEGLASYDEAFEIYREVDDFEQMAFILTRKLSIPLAAVPIERLREQALGARERALDLGLPDMAAQFVSVEAAAALRLSDRAAIAQALRRIEFLLHDGTGNPQMNDVFLVLKSRLQSALQEPRP